MKRIKLLILLFIPVMMLLLINCDETILRDDCENYDDIELTIKGKYSTACEPNELLTPRGAAITILAGVDTLFTGNLDSTGTFETGPIDNTGCGLSNAIIETSFMGSVFREEFGLLCCDTTLSYTFRNISCEPLKPIDCTRIDTTITRIITSSGDCVFQNATYNELRNNVVLISSASPVEIDIRELRILSGKIFLRNILPMTEKSTIILDGTALEIYFDVVRTEIGAIDPVLIYLPTSCLDEFGNKVNSGTIKIELSATVCDPYECYCPFSENDSPESYYASERVMMNSSKDFEFTILELTEGIFGEGCLLKIDSLKRIDGSDAKVTGANSWLIDSYNPTELKVGDKMLIKSKFEPKKTGDITEEFIVYTSVYSQADPTVKKNGSECSFRFKLNGTGCESVCPTVIPTATLVKKIYTNPAKEEIAYRGEKIEMSNQFYISQKIKGVMSTDCLDDLKEPGIAVFNIDVPKGDYCSDINLKVVKRYITVDKDADYFYTNITDVSIGDLVNSSFLTITFVPPNLEKFYSEFDNSFMAAFDLIASDDNGNELCRQEIIIESEVEEFSLGSRGTPVMEAFSQISSKAKVPSYYVYDIDTYNPKYKNYGSLNELNDQYVNANVVPNKPLSDHSLFFDVDSPDDPTINFTEKPELYLVNTVLNNFSKISANPVATFDSHEDFVVAYENGTLMNSIMSNANANVNGGLFSWADSRDKSEFVSTNGIEIKPYEVYIVWDPESQADEYVLNSKIKKHIFCGVALVYISSVKTGSDNTVNNTGGNGRAAVWFNVEYPLIWDKK